MIYPCLYCGRVRDPKNCENKLCKDWQAWFISRWDAMRLQIRQEMEHSGASQAGVPLGGERYPHPDAVREYLDHDPCDRCPCPNGLCQRSCPAKAAWQEKVRGVVR